MKGQIVGFYKVKASSTKKGWTYEPFKLIIIIIINIVIIIGNPIPFLPSSETALLGVSKLFPNMLKSCCTGSTFFPSERLTSLRPCGQEEAPHSCACTPSPGSDSHGSKAATHERSVTRQLPSFPLVQYGRPDLTFPRETLQQTNLTFCNFIDSTTTITEGNSNWNLKEKVECKTNVCLTVERLSTESVFVYHQKEKLKNYLRRVW